MAQLHFYVPDKIAEQIRRKAKEARVPVSQYLAGLVKRETELVDAWPEGYFEQVFGKWEGRRLRRAPQGQFEAREKLK